MWITQVIHLFSHSFCTWFLYCDIWFFYMVMRFLYTWWFTHDSFSFMWLTKKILIWKNLYLFSSACTGEQGGPRWRRCAVCVAGRLCLLPSLFGLVVIFTSFHFKYFNYADIWTPNTFQQQAVFWRAFCSGLERFSPLSSSCVGIHSGLLVTKALRSVSKKRRRRRRQGKRLGLGGRGGGVARGWWCWGVYPPVWSIAW